MKLKDIKSEENIPIYIEGCINDYTEFGITTKCQLVDEMMYLIIYLIQLDRKKNRPEIDLIKKIKKSCEEIDFKKINSELEVFEKNKEKIYLNIISEVITLYKENCINDIMAYMDGLEIFPSEKLIKPYLETK